MFWMLYAFFWVIPRSMNFICRLFGKHCLFQLHSYPPMKMEQSVPKRRHIKFRCWGITRKKAYKNHSVSRSTVFTGISDPAQFSYIVGDSAAFTTRCSGSGHTEIPNANSPWQIRTCIIMTATVHRVVFQTMYKIKPENMFINLMPLSELTCHSSYWHSPRPIPFWPLTLLWLATFHAPVLPNRNTPRP